jgi:hypothetical protein
MQNQVLKAEERSRMVLDVFFAWSPECSFSDDFEICEVELNNPSHIHTKSP